MNNIIVTNNSIIKPREIEYTVFVNELNNLLNEYYATLDLKKKTIKAYKDSINAFVIWLKNNKDKPICKQTLIEYKEYMIINYKPKTVNLYLSGLRQFFNFLEELGYPNVMKNIKNVKVGKGFTKSSLELNQFIIIENNMLKKIEVLEQKYKKKEIKKEKYLLILRNYAIFKLAVMDLLREIEISKADKVDIRAMQNRIILDIEGKGQDSKNDFVVLADDTIKAINKYLNVRGKDEFKPLYISISSNCYGGRLSTRSLSKILKNIFKEYGNIDTPRITGHSTRHTGATFLHLAKVDMRDIQEVARHQNISTTAIYVDTVNRLIEPAEYKLQDFINKERARLELWQELSPS